MEKIERGEGEEVTMEEIRLQCEFCEKISTPRHLTLHYETTHGVKEDKMRCGECGRGFKRREFFVVHLEEKHQKGLEEIQRIARALQVEEGRRKGLEIKMGGKKGRRKKREGFGGNEQVEVDVKPDLRLLKRKRRVVVICEEDGEIGGFGGN